MAVFAPSDDWFDEDDVTVLCYHEKGREFVQLYGCLDYRKNKVAFSQMEISKLNEKIKELKKKGYQEITY